MKRYYYDHGLPFSEVLEKNIDTLVERIDNNKASLLIIDGQIGEGKTTLAVHVADYINKKKGLKPIDLTKKGNKQLAMGGVDFQKKLRQCYKHNLPALIYDEAGDFSKRGALTQLNAMLNRTFDTFRAFKILIIICLPNFDALDNSLLEKGIPRLLINCRDRTKNYGGFAGYSLYLMYYLKLRMKKETVKPKAYQKVYCNFRGHFLDLEPKRSKQLDKLSTDNKLEIGKEQEIKMAGIVDYLEISKRVLRSVIWVKKTVSKLKIKPVRKIGRRQYFDNSVISIIADHIGDKKK